MILDIVWLILGLALIVYGADWLVDGASSLARRWGLSEFVIGLTIVGMGTSAPEMVVSVIGAIQGNADVAVGNVIGSNIFNVLLILGITALILPIPVTRENIRRDVPLNLFVTGLLILLGMKLSIFSIGENLLSRWDGALFLLLFIAYLVFCFRSGKTEETPSVDAPGRKLWVSLLMVAGGLGALIIGGRLFVDNATDIARLLGVSDKFIAVTILAGGTSLPELATCIAAAIKKKGQLALGNVIGSNLFNILLILGTSAVITPLSFQDIDWVDLGVLALSALYLGTSVIVGRRRVVDRLDGVLFFLTWVAYMAYLIITL